MINVMIVDRDNAMIKGLRSLLDWKSHGYSVICEANNGLDAIELLQHHAIELIFTNISNELTNVDELLAYVQRNLPRIKIVALTDNDDFIYSQIAIRYKVIDYLLQPVKLFDLEQLLKKIKNIMRNERKSIWEVREKSSQYKQAYREIKEDCVLHLLRGDVSSMVIQKAIQLNLEQWDEQHIQIVSIGLKRDPQRLSEQYMLPFELIARELVEQYDSFMILCIDNNYQHLIQIACITDNELININDALSTLLVKLEQIIGFELVVGRSHSIRGFHNWKQAYIVALLHCSLISFDLEINHPELVQLSKLDEKLMDLGLLEDKSQLLYYLHLRLNSAMLCSQNEFLRTVFEVVLTLDRLVSPEQSYSQRLWYNPDQLLQLNDVEPVMKHLSNYVKQILPSPKHDDYDSLFQKVMTYIHEHYVYELNLSSVANLFNIPYSEANKLFLQNIGKTFEQYVFEIRMQQAGNLLLTTELTLDDIAELTGFLSVGYFTSCFTQYYVQTPNEFREQYGLI